MHIPADEPHDTIHEAPAPLELMGVPERKTLLQGWITVEVVRGSNAHCLPVYKVSQQVGHEDT